MGQQSASQGILGGKMFARIWQTQNGGDIKAETVAVGKYVGGWFWYAAHL